MKDKCPGNPDTLPLSTGKFMRIAVRMLRSQSDLFQHRIDIFVRFFFSSDNPVSQQRFRNNIPHRHAGIQRSVRVLKNHLHIFAVRLQHFLIHV